MDTLIYGAMAVFGVSLVCEMLSLGSARLIAMLSGADRPEWVENLTKITRAWKSWSENW